MDRKIVFCLIIAFLLGIGSIQVYQHRQVTNDNQLEMKANKAFYDMTGDHPPKQN